MKIDVSSLSASELDQLIADAAERRAQLDLQHSEEPPEPYRPLFDPAWRSNLIRGSQGQVELHFLHPGYGWLGFQLPRHEVANLAHFFVTALASAAAERPPMESSSDATAATPMPRVDGRLH